MESYPVYKSITLTTPAIRTVVVRVTVWNECGMSGGMASGDFRRFDYPWIEAEQPLSEPHIPEKGVRWHEDILPVLAIRSVIKTDFGGERDNLPEIEDELLFLDPDDNGTRLTTIQNRDRLCERTSFQGIVCTWAAERDAEELRDTIEWMKREVWGKIVRNHSSGWTTTNGTPPAPAKPKRKLPAPGGPA